MSIPPVVYGTKPTCPHEKEHYIRVHADEDAGTWDCFTCRSDLWDRVITRALFGDTLDSAAKSANVEE